MRLRRDAPRVAAIAIVLAGCSIDTELGLDATLDAASAEVRDEAGTDVLIARLTVTYREGAHAEGNRTWVPTTIHLYSQGTFVADLPVTAPPTFTGRLMPGASAQVMLLGRSDTLTDPRALCGDEVEILLGWMDGATREPGTSTAIVTVSCP